MARINVEDSLYKDIRFILLIGKLGSVEMALGAMVRAWSLAQEWYLNEETDRLIPVADWKRQLLREEIVEVGLAEFREKGIYVVGADEQFTWLLQRQEAGKKGGRPPKPTEIGSKPTESGSNPLTLSLPPPLTLSPVSSKNLHAVEDELPAATGEFSVHEKLNGDPALREVLQFISYTVQEKWVARYELDWLKKNLVNAIHYHLEKENASNPAKIKDWGLRLGKWLRREKKPNLIDSGANLTAKITAFEAELVRSGEVKP